jgi:hypothetical protein
MLATSADSASPRPAPESRDLVVVTAAIAATAHAAQPPGIGGAPVSAVELLDALVLLRLAQTELASLEPTLIAAGLSWQALAPALGVASRQAAERRYWRGVSTAAGQPGATRDGRVQAERDRRAAHRAVAEWANDATHLAGAVNVPVDVTHRRRAANAAPTVRQVSTCAFPGRKSMRELVDMLAGIGYRFSR